MDITIFKNKWLWFFFISHLGGWLLTNVETRLILKDIRKSTDLIMHQLTQKD